MKKETQDGPRPKTYKAFKIVEYLAAEFRRCALLFPGTFTKKTEGEFTTFSLSGTYNQIEEFSQLWDRHVSKYDAEYISAIDLHSEPENVVFK